MIKLVLLLPLAVLLASCSPKMYMEPASGDYAMVSISYSSASPPNVEILKNCQSYVVDEKKLERRRPTDFGSQLIKAVPDQSLSIAYSYTWLGEEKYRYDLNYKKSVEFVDKVSTKEFSGCSGKLSFLPEAGKHYEVFLSLRGDACVSGVAQIKRNGFAEKKLYKVEHLLSENQSNC